MPGAVHQHQIAHEIVKDEASPEKKPPNGLGASAGGAGSALGVSATGAGGGGGGVGIAAGLGTTSSALGAADQQNVQ